jgi:hypothetical protein
MLLPMCAQNAVEGGLGCQILPLICRFGTIWQGGRLANSVELQACRNVSTILRQWLLGFRLGFVRLALVD